MSILEFDKNSNILFDGEEFKYSAEKQKQFIKDTEERANEMYNYFVRNGIDERSALTAALFWSSQRLGVRFDIY